MLIITIVNLKNKCTDQTGRLILTPRSWIYLQMTPFARGACGVSYLGGTSMMMMISSLLFSTVILTVLEVVMVPGRGWPPKPAWMWGQWFVGQLFGHWWQRFFRCSAQQPPFDSQFIQRPYLMRKVPTCGIDPCCCSRSSSRCAKTGLIRCLLEHVRSILPANYGPPWKSGDA